MSTGRKFKKGDRVIISQTTVHATDKVYSGQVGTVDSYTHRNEGMDVFDVRLDGGDYDYAFYDQDLLPYSELEALRVQLAEAEGKVVELRESIKLKERNATELPIATVVAYKDTYGPAAITKQAEDSWLNVYPTQNGNPSVERLNDNRVTQLLVNNSHAVIRNP